MSRILSRVLSMLVLGGILAAGPATAQTASATNPATLVIEPPPLVVTGGQPLDFGSLPAENGLVENILDAEWFIDGAPGTSVDLSFSLLPTSLQGPNGATAPLTYSSGSMGVYCGDGTGIYVDPAVGFTGCILNSFGGALVELGTTREGSFVLVDLTGLPEGAYSAVIELTAVVN